MNKNLLPKPGDWNLKEFCKTYGYRGGLGSILKYRHLRAAWHIAPMHTTFWIATRPGILSETDLRLFSIFCLESQMYYEMTFKKGEMIHQPLPGIKKAISAAKKLAYGKITEEERIKAKEEVFKNWLNIVRRCIPNHDQSLTYSYARSILHKNPMVSVKDTYYYYSIPSQILEKEVKWLRENTNPDFKEKPYKTGSYLKTSF